MTIPRNISVNDVIETTGTININGKIIANSNTNSVFSNIDLRDILFNT
ncbi:MAG: hypothetical protein ACP5N1_01485 [Candidatus Woesearchaeota archaeon]